MKAIKLLIAAGFALSIFIAANPSGAGLITSLPGGTVIPMPELPYGGYEGPGPQTFGPNITWNSTCTYSVFGWTQGAAFGANGSWAVSPFGPIAVLSSAPETMTFAFSTPVQAVGGFLNYYYWSPTATTFTIAAYDSWNNLIESATLSFSTGGGYNTGFFYGFQEASSRIKYFKLSGGVIGITNLTILAGEPIPLSPVAPLLLLLE